MGFEVGEHFFGPSSGLREAGQREHHTDADGVAVGVKEAAAGDVSGAAEDFEVRAVVAAEPEAFLDRLARQREGFLHAEGVLLGVGLREQAGLLGEERVHSVAGDDQLRSDVAVGPVGSDADDAAGGVAQQLGGDRGGHQLRAGVHGFARQPSIEVRAVGGHPVVRCVPPVLGAEVDREGLGGGHHHGAAAGDPPLHRRVFPPAG